MSRRSRRESAGSPLSIELGGIALSVPEGTSVDDAVALPALGLLAEHAAPTTDESILVAPCGSGLLGAWAASAARCTVTCLDTHALAVDAATHLLADNSAATANARVGIPDETDGPFDVFLMPLPKGRDLARLWLLNGAMATRRAGRVIIAGHNSAGIQSFARDAALLLGTGRLLGYKGGCRAIAFERLELSWESLPDEFAVPGMRSGTYATYTLSLPGREGIVCTRPGVFSREGLDEGTRRLLEVIQVEPRERVLDLGCGAGVIALALSAMAPDLAVTLVDVDSLAIECARETLQRNGVQPAALLLGDGLATVRGQRFDLIATNPPFHSGHAVNTELTAGFIRDASAALLPGGRLVLVANAFLPYARWLQDEFDAVNELYRDTRFVVYCASEPRRLAR